MTYVLLGISMAACLFGGMIRKYSGDKFIHKNTMYFAYNGVVSFAGAVVLLLSSKEITVSWFTVLLGIVFGVITAAQQIFNLKALDKGPYSYTSVIVSLSTIIPALSGYALWNENISGIQVVGIVLMLISFVCSVDYSGTQKKASWLWLLYATATFILTGLIGVLQKWHQSTDYKGELDGFLLIAFGVSALFSLIRLTAVKSGPVLKQEITRKLLGIMVFAGVCAALNNKINLYLSGVMDSAVFFPVVNGGGLVLSLLASRLVFKEKFNVQKLVGIVIGILAVILLCNPF